MTVQNPYGTPPPPPAKKGLSPLAWVGIGCGALLICAVIVFAAIGYMAKKKLQEFGENPEMAAAQLILRANPDLEVVNTDDEAGTITVRDKKSGEETTLNLSDIKEGRIEIKSDKGSVTMDGTGMTVEDEKGETSTFTAGAGAGDIPDWVPIYPGGNAQGNFLGTTAEGSSGIVTVNTSDSAEKVLEFYKGKLEGDGYTVQQSTTNSNGEVSGIVSGTTADEKRTLAIVVSPSSGGTGNDAVINYSEKK